jgi:hypothetical protein
MPSSIEFIAGHNAGFCHAAGGQLHRPLCAGDELPFAATGLLPAVDLGHCGFLLPRKGAAAAASPDIWPLLLDRSVLVAAAAVTLAAIRWGITCDDS